MDHTPPSELPKDAKPEHQPGLHRGARFVKTLRSAKKSERDEGWRIVSGFAESFPELLAMFRLSTGSINSNRVRDVVANAQRISPPELSYLEAMPYNV